MNRLLFLTLITCIAGQVQANKSDLRAMVELYTKQSAESDKATYQAFLEAIEQNKSIVVLHEFEPQVNCGAKPRFGAEKVLDYDPYTSRRFIKRQEEITQQVTSLLKTIANTVDNQQL